MKHFTLTICSAAVLLFSCNNDGEKKDAAKKDSTATTTEQTTAKEVAPAPMPDSATMMKNWMAYMTPGNMHKLMASWDGTWDGDMTMWQAPGAPPQTTKGTAVNKMIMGGRYQLSDHKSMMMGQPFDGMSILAYDNNEKKFKSTWIDNMGTGIMSMDGPWDEATKTLKLKGKCLDPMMGKEVELREDFKVIDDKTQLMEMYSTGPDGKEFKMMEIKLTKKK